MMQTITDWVTGSYAFAVIGGPILLGLALVYGIMRSRRGREANMDATSLEDIERRPGADHRPGVRNSRARTP
jgi:hypothetical protein